MGGAEEYGTVNCTGRPGKPIDHDATDPVEVEVPSAVEEAAETLIEALQKVMNNSIKELLQEAIDEAIKNATVDARVVLSIEDEEEKDENGDAYQIDPVDLLIEMPIGNVNSYWTFPLSFLVGDALNELCDDATGKIAAPKVKHATALRDSLRHLVARLDAVLPEGT